LFAVSPAACFPQAVETVTYYYTNQQGAPVVTADASGNILSTADYEPYGTQQECLLYRTGVPNDRLRTTASDLGSTGDFATIELGLANPPQ